MQCVFRVIRATHYVISATCTQAIGAVCTHVMSARCTHVMGAPCTRVAGAERYLQSSFSSSVPLDVMDKAWMNSLKEI